MSRNKLKYNSDKNLNPNVSNGEALSHNFGNKTYLNSPTFQLKNEGRSNNSESGVNLKSSSLPFQLGNKMASSFGTDFSNVNIHQNSYMASNLGAKAFTKGDHIHFAPGEFNPKSKSGQELLGHELAHVVQQRKGKISPTKNRNGVEINDEPKLEREADNYGKKASSGENVAINNTPSSVSNPGVVQGYFLKNYALSSYRQADDLSVVVDQDSHHKLYAKSGKVAAANTELKAAGSNIELQEKSESSTFYEGPWYWKTRKANLKRVIAKNKTNNTSGDDMKLWADCGRSNSEVVGSSTRSAVYTSPFSGRKKETNATTPAEMKSEIYKDYMETQLLDPGTSMEKRIIIFNILGRAQAKQLEIDAALTAYHSATSEADKEAKLNIYWAKVSQKSEILLEYYRNHMTAKEKEDFNRKLGLNEFANPGVGEGFTTSSGGNPIPGNSTWNFHWGGVIMESNDKKDKIVLENYSVSDWDAENKEWEFQMYGTEKKGQSFHEQHAETNQHGDTPTTMHIKKKQP